MLEVLATSNKRPSRARFECGFEYIYIYKTSIKFIMDTIVVREPSVPKRDCDGNFILLYTSTGYAMMYSLHPLNFEQLY